MNERVIFNYQLIWRRRNNPLWLTLYISVLMIGFFINIFVTSEMVWIHLSLLVTIYYIVYLFWGIWYLRMIKRKMKIAFPFIPWFGVFPKNIISFHEYKRFEFSYLFFSVLSFSWILFLLPNTFYLFSFSFIFSLFMFRVFIFIRIFIMNKSNLLIKYDTYGISVYRQD